MNLLYHPEGSGYPTEYLIARLCGRRVNLVKDWDTLLYSPGSLDTLVPSTYRELILQYAEEGIWKRMLKEFRWVYLQMNRKLRHTFSSFFSYSEIKTIILCLRYKAEKETGGLVEDLLPFSLLSEKVKKILKSGEELSSILEELEGKFLYPPDKSPGLGNILLHAGLRGIEQKLSQDLMEQIIHSRLESILIMFFSRLIDIKNIITVYKNVRWSVKTESPIIQGGSISGSCLKKLVQSSDMSGLIRLIHKLTGVKIYEPNATVIENTLYTSLTRHLSNLSREQPDKGLILDHLWKTYIEAVNLSILYYGRNVEREDIRKELVLL